VNAAELTLGEEVPERTAARPPALLFAIFAVVLAHAPLLALHFWQTWSKEHYQYIPFVPLAAWALGVRMFRRSGLEMQPSRNPLIFVLFGLGGAALIFASINTSPKLGVLAFILSTAGVILWAGGWRAFRAVFGAWLFLFLMLPPPEQYDARLLQSLQRATVVGSTAVYEWSGGLCSVVGTVVQLPTQTLFVDEACSGVRSLFATLCCTLFYLGWVGRGWIHGALVVASSLGWVLVANVLRVLLILFFSKPDVFDLTKGTLHTTLGALTFAVAILLTMSTDRLLLVINPAREYPDEEPEPVTWPKRAFGFGTAFLGLLFLGLGGGGGWQLYKAFHAERVAWTDAFLFPILGVDFLPAEIGEWKRIRYEHIRRAPDDQLSINSQVWVFSNGPQTALISLDYPYSGVHDLEACYRGIGWIIDDRKTLQTPRAGAAAGDVIQLRMQKGNESYQTVIFAAFNGDGEPVTLGTEAFWENQWRRFFVKQKIRQAVYQVQVVSESNLPVTPEHVHKLRELLFTVRKNFSAPDFKAPPPG
jgi:exosortase